MMSTVEAYRLVRRRLVRLLGLYCVVVLRFALLALLCFAFSVKYLRALEEDGLLSMLRVF